MTDFNNNSNFIDSRDIIERIDELTDEIETGLENDEDMDSEKDELIALLALQDDCNYGDWESGATLINDSYFTEYAEQTADDLYGIQDCWPFNTIDWAFAAEQLQQDYTSINFDGAEFWIRS